MKKYFFKKTVNIANSKTEIQKRALLNLPSNYRLDKKKLFYFFTNVEKSMVKI